MCGMLVFGRIGVMVRAKGKRNGRERVGEMGFC